MKHLRIHRLRAQGFTLTEIVVAVGIAAGTIAILAGLMTILARDVRRLKPYEATRRLAFQAESKSTANTGTSTNDSGPKLNQTLPDEHLDPGTRAVDETKPATDPDDPTTVPGDGSSGTGTGGPPPTTN